MLKIYDTKDQIPEGLVEHYERRSDGKYEPKVEGINSIGGLLAKRDELLEKVKELPGLKTKVLELEGLETLPAGKIAVDKKEFESLKASNEAYTALGPVDEIKPKVEGYDELKTKDEQRVKEDLYRTAARVAGFNEAKFVKFASDEGIETLVKTVKENGKETEKVYVTADGKETDISDYVRDSTNPFADTLTAASPAPGTKVIRQGTTTPATPTLETEVEAHAATGRYNV